MNTKRFFLPLTCVAAAVFLSGCLTTEMGGPPPSFAGGSQVEPEQDDPRAIGRIYSADEVRRIFLRAVQTGDRALALTVADPAAVRKLNWVPDPAISLWEDGTLVSNAYDIVLEIHGDGHVGSRIVDVTVRGD